MADCKSERERADATQAELFEAQQSLEDAQQEVALVDPEDSEAATAARRKLREAIEKRAKALVKHNGAVSLLRKCQKLPTPTGGSLPDPLGGEPPVQLWPVWWEQIDWNLWRWRVQDGWLVRSNTQSLAYIPDPKSEWRPLG